MDYKYINTEYLETVSGNDTEVIRELITIFREQLMEICEEMKSLLEKKEYGALGMLAHKAKSSVAIMGMNDLASMLKTFELEAKEAKGVEKYEMYIDRFERETKLAVEELNHYINNR